MCPVLRVYINLYFQLAEQLLANYVTVNRALNITSVRRTFECNPYVYWYHILVYYTHESGFALVLTSDIGLLHAAKLTARSKKDYLQLAWIA
jgi:hypothetical protein